MVSGGAVGAAAPAGRERGHPLVVLSPGFTKNRATLTALAEDLASHGYVVAGIDHTYESGATTFPDGRVTTCLARTAPPHGPDRWEQIVTGRAADVSFVLDELTGPRIPDGGLARPFLFLGKESFVVGKRVAGSSVKKIPEDTWGRDWRLLTGWRRWLTVAGAMHAAGTDGSLM